MFHACATIASASARVTISRGRVVLFALVRKPLSAHISKARQTQASLLWVSKIASEK